jgi:nucleoside-diphosphate-sugar epimerase
MRIFVAGATGILGRRAVAALVDAGHDVTGVTRSAEKAALLEKLGATAEAVDVFDAAAVARAVAGHEVVANLATHIPTLSRMRLRSAWRENDRIRGEVSRNLVDASLATGVSRYIQESIAFMYADAADAWIDEDAPLDVLDYVEAGIEAEAQARRVTDAGKTGIVLRFGMFHAPESEQTQMVVRMARRRVFAMFGPKDGYLPAVSVDDCATAVVAALGAPPGVYNIVDDEPLTRTEYATALAEALGVKSLRFPPAVAARAAGSPGSMLARSQRVSNARFKQATGWAPRYSSFRDGWPAMVAAVQDAAHA